MSTETKRQQHNAIDYVGDESLCSVTAIGDLVLPTEATVQEARMESEDEGRETVTIVVEWPTWDNDVVTAAFTVSAYGTTITE